MSIGSYTHTSIAAEQETEEVIRPNLVKNNNSNKSNLAAHSMTPMDEDMANSNNKFKNKIRKNTASVSQNTQQQLQQQQKGGGAGVGGGGNLVLPSSFANFRKDQGNQGEAFAGYSYHLNSDDNVIAEANDVSGDDMIIEQMEGNNNNNDNNNESDDSNSEHLFGVVKTKKDNCNNNDSSDNEQYQTKDGANETTTPQP